MGKNQKQLHSKLKSALFYAAIFLFVAAVTFLFQHLLKNNSEKSSDAGDFQNLKITVIDVGNADSILLEHMGQTMLIDAGENNDEDKILRYLNRKSIKKLDFIIATHPDADHIGGMDAVINNFEIGRFYMPILPAELTPTTATYKAMLTALDKRDVDVFEGLKGEKFEIGEVAVEFLWPVAGLNESNNNFSIVAMLTHGENKFLFMGDAEKEAESAILESGISLKSAFLKAGHHGSRTSSTDAFIKAVNPAICVITSGQNNRYNHPHLEVLKRFEKYNSKVYRSDINGDIIVESDGFELSVTTEK